MTRRKNDTPAPAIPTNLPPIPVAGNGEPSPVGPPEAVSPPGRRTLNGRFLACLLIAALLLGAGVHLLHAYQVRRNASALLTHANQAEEDGDLDRAIQYLEHYLGLVQEDNDALARYGRALYKRGGSADEKQRAFLVLEQVVRRKPDRRDVRRDLVDVAMDLEDYPAALQHLDELLKASPSDAELERVAAACETAAGRLDRAEGWLQQAIRHAPDQVAGYVQLAALYRNRLQQPDKADEIMAKLVQANERSFQAHLARWHYQKELGRAEAEADLARAQELAPDAADVILAAAESAEARGEVALVRAGLERGIGLYPQDYRMYQALAALEIRAGQYREAAAIAERGLKAVPGQVEELLPTLAEALIEQGELARAREQLDQLRKLKISEARRDYLEARVLVHQKEWAAAAALLERIRLRLNARSSLVVPVNLSLAYCYGQLGNPDQQLAACRRAVAANPQAVAPRQALAAALLTVGRLDEAAEEYRRLSAQVPGALVALAGVQLVQTLSLPPAKRRWEPVNRTLDAAAQAVSDSTEVALLRSEALAAQGQPEAARQVLEAARDRRPGDVEVWAALADLLQRQGELDQALAVLEQARQQLGDTADLRL
ncbi:MAG TPA: tetratricopeptide repeat protein, partial [Gemmataceae bacterium]|nr:tetratricopeptide repeat protein [Gemmataceae bacterium]